MRKIKEITEWATAFKTHSDLLIFVKRAIIHLYPAGLPPYFPGHRGPTPPDPHPLPIRANTLPFHIGFLSAHCQSGCV